MKHAGGSGPSQSSWVAMKMLNSSCRFSCQASSRDLAIRYLSPVTRGGSGKGQIWCRQLKFSCGDFLAPCRVTFLPIMWESWLVDPFALTCHNAERHPVPRLLLQLENTTNSSTCWSVRSLCSADSSYRRRSPRAGVTGIADSWKLYRWSTFCLADLHRLLYLHCTSSYSCH